MPVQPVTPSTEREAIIRDHWARHSRSWRPSYGRAFRVAVEQPVPVVAYAAVANPDILEFRLEEGTFDGMRATRVVCEGVVLELVVR